MNDGGVCRTAPTTPGLLTRWVAQLMPDHSPANSQTETGHGHSPSNFGLLDDIRCLLTWQNPPIFNPQHYNDHVC